MKILVMYQKGSSTLSAGFKLFSTENDAKVFIDKKTLSGMDCHVFDYRESYNLTQTITKTKV